MKNIWALLSFILLCFQPLAAMADDAITDFDKRAAATLYSAYAGKELDPQKITPQQLKPGLTRYERDDANKKATYAMNFGVNENGVDNRGFYRITVGEELVDAAKGGWTVLRTEAATGAEILWKTIDKSDADKYLQIAARKKVGRVVMTIAQRRGLNENVQTAADDVAKRFTAFLAQANRCKLFGAKIRMVLVNRDDQPELGSGEPLLFSTSDTEEQQIIVRIEVTDGDDKPIADLKHVSLELGGSLAPIVKTTIAGNNVDLTKRHLEKNPQPVFDVTITVPPTQNPEILTALYNALAGDPASTPLTLKVGAAMK